MGSFAPAVRRAALLEQLGVVVLLGVLAVAATWPLATDPAGLSIASAANNDVYLNQYLIFWGAHALAHEPTRLYHPNIFWPARYTFAYADMLLSSSVLMAPVIAFTHDPTLTYNLLLLTSILIGGLGVFHLAGLIVRPRWPAVAAAAIYAFNPLHFSRYRQPQLFTDHWLPWMLLALLLWLESRGLWRRPASGRWPERSARPALWRSLLVAVLFCLHALTGSHNAVFGALLGAAVAAWTVTGALRRRAPVAWCAFAREAAAFALLCLLVLGPAFYPYFVERDRLLQQRLATGPERELVLDAGAAHLPELLGSGTRVYRWLDRRFGWPSRWVPGFGRRGGDLYPGLAFLLLALAGALAAGTQTKRPIGSGAHTRARAQAPDPGAAARALAASLDAVPLAASLLAARVLVTGVPFSRALPAVAGADTAPHSTLWLAAVAAAAAAVRWSWLPGPPHLLPVAAGALRRWYRADPDRAFWAAVALVCFWLALGPRAGLYRLVQWLPGAELIRVPRRFLLPGALAMSLLAARALAAAAGWRRGRAAAVLLLGLFAVESCYAPLPLAPEPYRRAPLHDWLAAQAGEFAILEVPIDDNPTAATRQMLESVWHWKKLVIGYSGSTPPGYAERMRRLAAGFPSDAVLDELVRLGVRYAIVAEPKLSPALASAIRGSRRLRPVQRFSTTTVYRILPPEAGP